jgi:hypothetical protein
MQFAFFRLSACSYAYQNSLFPLGISGDNIIFLEVELERYVNTSSGGEMLILQDPLSKNIIETRWKGNLRIKKSNDARTFLLIEELAYIDISDKDYNLALLPYFEKAMEKARNELFFEEAFLIKTAGCGYERSCTMFQLEPDTLELALYCSLEPNSKQKTKIEFPKILLQKYENVTQLNFSEIETVEAESRMEFYKIWKPCSARYYRIGDRDMIIYCIGWGQKRGYNGIKEDKWKPNLLPVEQFVEGNDVMVHGQRFDSCQIF